MTETVQKHRLTFEVDIDDSVTLAEVLKAKEALATIFPDGFVFFIYGGPVSPVEASTEAAAPWAGAPATAVPRSRPFTMREGGGGNIRIPRYYGDDANFPDALPTQLRQGQGAVSIHRTPTPDESAVDELSQFAPDFADIDPEEYVRELRAD